MYMVNTTLEDAISEFEFVNDWIDNICQNFLNKNREKCKISVFYNYGYFVPKKEGVNEEQYSMLFKQRLKYEKSKVRVNIVIKVDDFMMTTRLKKGKIPKIVKQMVVEITKYKMQIEYDFHQNDEIKESIPPIDESVVSVEIIRQEVNPDKIEESYFDLDEILDKIQSDGIESLTKKEREFLDRKSKEM